MIAGFIFRNFCIYAFFVSRFVPLGTYSAHTGLLKFVTFRVVNP